MAVSGLPTLISAPLKLAGIGVMAYINFRSSHDGLREDAFHRRIDSGLRIVEHGNSRVKCGVDLCRDCLYSRVPAPRRVLHSEACQLCLLCLTTVGVDPLLELISTHCVGSGAAGIGFFFLCMEE